MKRVLLRTVLLLPVGVLFFVAGLWCRLSFTERSSAPAWGDPLGSFLLWPQYLLPEPSGSVISILYVLLETSIGWALAISVAMIPFRRTNQKKESGPNQPTQRNAGSRPSSGDSSASETPSSLGPRG